MSILEYAGEPDGHSQGEEKAQQRDQDLLGQRVVDRKPGRYAKHHRAAENMPAGEAGLGAQIKGPGAAYYFTDSEIAAKCDDANDRGDEGKSHRRTGRAQQPQQYYCRDTQRGPPISIGQGAENR